MAKGPADVVPVKPTPALSPDFEPGDALPQRIQFRLITFDPREIGIQNVVGRAKAGAIALRQRSRHGEAPRGGVEHALMYGEKIWKARL